MPRADLPVRQKHIEVFLKSSDRAEECPEIDRCQLELIRNEDPALIIDDTNLPQSKLVRVGIVKEGSGCDYKVRVGLSGNNGPIAVGGEVHYTDNGTVYNIWERKLQGCIDPRQIFLEKMPVNLLNVRYLIDRERISLITYQDIEGNWRVVVERRGKLSPDPLRLLFNTSRDNLVVSAALSMDGQQLYVVASRMPGTAYGGTWEVHSYNRYSGIWEKTANGSVSSPPGSSGPGARPFRVDRDGRVAGYWSTVFEIITEQVANPTGWCPGGLINNGDEITDYTTRWRDYQEYYGGYWEIARNGAYVPGSSRVGAAVMVDGDLLLVEEKLLSTGKVRLSHGEYTWGANLVGFYGQWTRSQTADIDESERFVARAGALVIDSYLQDYGYVYEFSASSVAMVTLTYVEPAWIQRTTFDEVFERFRSQLGARLMEITAGGWVAINEYQEITTPDDMSSINIDETVERQPPITSWGMPVCPDFYNELANGGMTDSVFSEKTIIYPQSLGNFTAIHRSFSSYDQVSGDEYVGVLVQVDSHPNPVWHVFKNRTEVTAAISHCIGRPIDQLAAIYWRA